MTANVILDIFFSTEKKETLNNFCFSGITYDMFKETLNKLSITFRASVAVTGKTYYSLPCTSIIPDILSQIEFKVALHSRVTLKAKLYSICIKPNCSSLNIQNAFTFSKSLVNWIEVLE